MNTPKFLSVLMIGASLAISAPAQTPPPPAPNNLLGAPPAELALSNNLPTGVQSFVATVGQFVSSFDTNSTTFHSAHELDVIIGADDQQGISSGSLKMAYEIWTVATNTTIGVEETTRFTGVGGAVLSQQLGFELSRVLYDTKFSIGIDGGYALDARKPFGEVALQILKATTPNTFVGALLGVPVDGDGPHTPRVSVLWGFKL